MSYFQDSTLSITTRSLPVATITCKFSTIERSENLRIFKCSKKIPQFLPQQWLNKKRHFMIQIRVKMFLKPNVLKTSLN